MESKPVTVPAIKAMKRAQRIGIGDPVARAAGHKNAGISINENYAIVCAELLRD